MKNLEKDVKKLLSDDMLLPRESFKQNLRKDVLKKSQYPKSARRFVIPAVATSFAAIAILAGVLTFDPDNISKNPFTPQKVSAQELIKKLSTYPATLEASGKTFLIRKDTSIKGPEFGWCQPEGLGDVAGSGEYYVYNAKDSGVEALYSKAVSDSGQSKEILYYNPNAEELRTWISGFNNDIPYAQGEGYMVGGLPTYLIVDAAGNQLKDDTLVSKKINGREVFEFYVKENVAATGRDLAPEPYRDLPKSVWCDPTKEMSKVVVDAQTHAIVESVNYHGPASDGNIVLTYKTSIELKDIDEAAALKEMSRAGFVRQRASSVLPGGRD